MTCNQKDFGLIRTIKLISIFTICIFLGTVPSFAIDEISQGAILGLDECIELAIKNSPKVNIALNNMKVTKSRIGQAKSDFFPRFGIDGGYSGTNMSYDGRSTSDDVFSAGVALNQLIYNFGKTGAKIKTQEFYNIASTFDYDNTVLSTVNEVKNAYYGVLAAKASQEVAYTNVEINKRQYGQIKAYYVEGLKSRIDFINAEVNLSNSRIDLITAQASYDNALVRLNNSMYIVNAPEYMIKNTETFNLEDDWADVKFLNIANYKALEEEISSPSSILPDDLSDKPASLTIRTEKTDILENYSFKPYDKTFAEVLQIAKEQRPDFKSYAATRDAMKEALKYTKKEYFPEISARAGYDWRESDSISNRGWNYSAMLSVPLVNIMSTKTKVEEAEAQLDIAEENLNLIEKSIYFEVQNAYITMIQLEKQIPLVDSRVAQALENFRLADGRYGTGLGNFIELQDARGKYINAQQEYVQTIYNYNTARTTLETAMGVR